MAEPTTLIEVKNYFEIKSSAEMAAEWKKLTDANREEIKRLVGEIIHPDS